MTAITDAQLADLRARIVGSIRLHELTSNGEMQRVQDMRDAVTVLDEVVRLREDKKGLQDQIGRLLREIDNLDKLRGDTLTMTCGDEVVEYPLAGTMHLHGQTPDWYVEAAFWSCYGHSPCAALTTEKNDG